ncbi:MAG: CRISPR-associated endonuclease Cas1 [Kouleothrix sp.]
MAKAFVGGKLQSQANMLRYAARHRKAADPELHQALTLAATEVLDPLPAQPERRRDRRGDPRGADGCRGCRRALLAGGCNTHPTRAGLAGARNPQGARDRFNATLNYGYGVRWQQVRQALLLAGLDFQRRLLARRLAWQA